MNSHTSDDINYMPENYRGRRDIVYIDYAQFTPPTKNRECSEVIWSNGTSCRRCPNKDCYRNGWLKKAVTEDNQKLVKETMGIRYGKSKESEDEDG